MVSSMGPLERNAPLVSGKPDGQPIVFAHGFGCDSNMWRFVAPRYEDATSRSSPSTMSATAGRRAAAFDPERYSSLDG